MGHRLPHQIQVWKEMQKEEEMKEQLIFGKVIPKISFSVSLNQIITTTHFPCEAYSVLGS